MSIFQRYSKPNIWTRSRSTAKFYQRTFYNFYHSSIKVQSRFRQSSFKVPSRHHQSSPKFYTRISSAASACLAAAGEPEGLERPDDAEDLRGEQRVHLARVRVRLQQLQGLPARHHNLLQMSQLQSVINHLRNFIFSEGTSLRQVFNQ